MSRPFTWLGGHPAADLVNTEPVVDGVVEDLLEDVDDLVAWARAAGVAGEHDGLRGGGRTLAFARRLRTATRTALDPATRCDTAWAGVDGVLAEAPGTLRLDPEAGTTALVGDTPGARLRAALAEAVADIVHHDLARVRACAADDCGLVFLDTSRAGRRRWCDMAACGNRAKTTAHQIRHRRT